MEFAKKSRPVIEHKTAAKQIAAMCNRKGQKMSFAERLKTTRKQKGYSQEQLAELLDVSRQSVTKWETGLSYPEIKTLLELSSILEKDLDWLLYDEKPDSRKYNHCRYSLFNKEYEIPDLKALKNAMEEDLLIEILRVLNGYEITRSIESEELSGSQTCIIYAGRVFADTNGSDPEGKEVIHTFSEMNPSEIRALLLPWRDIRKSSVGSLPEVAKMQPEDGGNRPG